ncbi:hypothetical protein [Nocardia sp. NPDC052566]|uniref:hypothetical protein n=1 Tax=Nocardia sp. NPDC052566 TaxID=3364330 RepID=UPI0037CA0027
MTHGTDGSGKADFYATTDFYGPTSQRVTVEWDLQNQPLGTFISPRRGVGYYIDTDRYGAEGVLRSLLAALREPEKLDSTRYAPPPANVIAGPIAATDVQTYPGYFLNGPGLPRAEASLCEHGLWLTDSCAVCP